MIRWSMSEAAQAINAKRTGEDGEFIGVSTDSRKVEKNGLFIALKGERFDGHDYVQAVADAGAAGVLADRDTGVALPHLIVEDTRLGLGRLAAAWRARHELRVVGITGSNGKTTNKEMVQAILSQVGPTLATQGNFNNEIGMPLTLLRLTGDEQFAVIEMGANHPGEIAYMANICKPDVAMITNVGPAHLEGFGSLQGVCKAKGEIYDALAENGVVVINADDVFAPVWRERVGHRPVADFGLVQPARYSASHAPLPGDRVGSLMLVKAPEGEVSIELPLPGVHNVMNALGAIACSSAMGAGLREIRQGLEGLSAVKGRLQATSAAEGVSLINDTYNANPASFKAAIDVLMAEATHHQTCSVLVLGDMGELGEDTERMHAQLGEDAAQAGVQHLYALGPNSEIAVQAYSDASSEGQARHYADLKALLADLQADLQANRAQPSVVLVKGSRSMRMERVVEALTDSQADSDARTGSDDHHHQAMNEGMDNGSASEGGRP